MIAANKQTPLVIGGLTLETPILLAPMAGYTDLPFRHGIRGLGGLGLAFTEMLNPKCLLVGGGRKRGCIIATSTEDRPLAYQIYGKDPVVAAEAAQWLVARGAQLIDINMGCPQRKIAASGAGAGLLRDPSKALTMAQKIVAAVRVPVTAKLRLGWDDKSLVAVNLAKDLEQAGIVAVTVHGRTVGQRYTGKADWQQIRDVVAAVERIPVIANGDITSVEKARAVFSSTGCAGIMLGRGALKNPWLIREIWADMQGSPLPPPTRQERIAYLFEHFERHAEHYGEEYAAVLFRKWIPQYARGLRIRKPDMVVLLNIRQTEELRAAFRQLPV